MRPATPVWDRSLPAPHAQGRARPTDGAACAAGRGDTRRRPQPGCRAHRALRRTASPAGFTGYLAGDWLRPAGLPRGSTAERLQPGLSLSARDREEPGGSVGHDRRHGRHVFVSKRGCRFPQLGHGSLGSAVVLERHAAQASAKSSSTLSNDGCPFIWSQSLASSRRAPACSPARF